MGFRQPLTALSDLIADRIIGAFIATAETGMRLVMEPDVFGPTIKFYTGDARETVYGAVEGRTSGGADPQGSISVRPPIMDSGNDLPSLYLDSGDGDSTLPSARLTGAGGGIELYDYDSASGDGVGVRLGRLQSRGIRAFDFGYTGAATTDASGNVVVAHDCQDSPVAVLCWPAGGTAPYLPFITPASLTAVDFTVKLRKMTDNTVAPAGTTAAFYWVALR